MLVCDQVMNNTDVHAVYKPTEGLKLPPLEADQVTQPVDLRTVQESRAQTTRAAAETDQQREETRNQMQQLQHTRGSRYRELLNLNEFARMHEALLKQFGHCFEEQLEETTDDCSNYYYYYSY
jgi:hypothetical protein